MKTAPKHKRTALLLWLEGAIDDEGLDGPGASFASLDIGTPTPDAISTTEKLGKVLSAACDLLGFDHKRQIPDDEPIDLRLCLEEELDDGAFFNTICEVSLGVSHEEAMMADLQQLTNLAQLLMC